MGFFKFIFAEFEPCEATDRETLAQLLLSQLHTIYYNDNIKCLCNEIALEWISF